MDRKRRTRSKRDSLSTVEGLKNRLTHARGRKDLLKQINVSDLLGVLKGALESEGEDAGPMSIEQLVSGVLDSLPSHVC